MIEPETDQVVYNVNEAEEDDDMTDNRVDDDDQDNDNDNDNDDEDEGGLLTCHC